MTSAIYPDLKDKTVFISGGGSGIGADFTRGFARQGAKVAFIDISEEPSRSLVAELHAETGTAPLFINADVTDIAALQAAIAQAAEAHGPTRVLVNNAASDTRHDFDEVTPDYWDSRINVNVRHQFFAAQSVRKGMAAAGGGSIINMGSCSWYLGLGGMPVYLTAKAAVAGLTRALATELGPDRIRVNCIVPGFVRIERTIRDFITPEFEKDILNGQRLPDLVDGSDIADMALFLGSDASKRCTNQNYAVDGGWM
jgi:D-xylose 1-dehydrogenase